MSRTASCIGGVGASACALAHVTGRQCRAMQPTAQAWPIGRARLGAACFALLAHARAASALIALLMVQMRTCPLWTSVRGLQRGDPLPGSGPLD